MDDVRYLAPRPGVSANEPVLTFVKDCPTAASRRVVCAQRHAGREGLSWLGADFGTEYTVFDAGLARFVRTDKADFVGRDADLAQRKRAADCQFAGFVVESDDADPLPSDPITVDGQVVGYVTSASEGFRTGTRLALGYLTGGLAEVGKVFEIEVPGQPCTAVFTPTPFR